MTLQHVVDRQETLHDTLRKVPALHAEADGDLRSDTVSPPDMDPCNVDGLCVLHLPRRPLYRDWIRRHVTHMATQRDGHVLMIDLALHEPVDRCEKILAVISRVEAQDVGTQEVLQHFLLPGADAEGLGIRPRNMPEEHD